MTRLKAHDDSAWRNNSVKFEEVNALNLEKTKLYYNQIRSEDLCDYCTNNIHEVKAAYPTSFIDTP